MSDQSQQPPSQTPAAAPAATPTTTPPASPSADTPPAQTETPKNEDGTDLGTADKPADTSTDLGSEDAPAGDTPPAEPWKEFHGAPVNDKGEPIGYEITAPDGLAVDEELKAEFEPVARELNLSAKGAEKLVKLKAQDAQRQLKRWGDHLGELKKTAMADPEVGGAAYSPALQLSKQTITKIAGDRAPAFRKMLNDYGVGAHPEMIAFMARVGKLTGETPVLPSGGGAGPTDKPLHELMYKDT